MIDSPFIYQYGNLKPFKQVRMKSTINMSYKTQLDKNEFMHGSVRVNGLNEDKRDDYDIPFEFIIDEEKDDINLIRSQMDGRVEKIFFIQTDSRHNSKDPVKVFWQRGVVEKWIARKEPKKALRGKTIVDCSIKLLSPGYFLCDDQDLDTIKYGELTKLRYDSGFKYDQEGSVPSDINNLSLHFDFTDASTMSVAGDGKVSSVNDKSVNGLRLVQTAASKQPVFTQNVFSDQAALQFNGGQSLTFDDLDWDGVSPFVPDNFTSSGEYTVFIVTKTDRSASEARFYLGASNDQVFEGHTSNKFAYRAANTGGSDTTTIDWTFSFNPVVVTSTRNTSNIVKAGLNDSVLSNMFNEAAQAGDRIIATVGARNPNAFHWFGAIAEIIVYNRELTDSEREQIYNYIYRKYNITVGNFTPAALSPERYDSLEVSSTRYLHEFSTTDKKRAFSCQPYHQTSERGDDDFMEFYEPVKLRHKDRFFEQVASYKFYNMLRSNFDLSSTAWVKVNCTVNPQRFDAINYPNQDRDVDTIQYRYFNELTFTTDFLNTYIQQQDLFLYREDNCIRFKMKKYAGDVGYFRVIVNNPDGSGEQELPITAINSGNELLNGWYEHKITFICTKETYRGLVRIQFFSTAAGDNPSQNDRVWIKDLQLYNPLFCTQDPLVANVCGNVLSPLYNGQNSFVMVASENSVDTYKTTFELNHQATATADAMIIAISQMQTNDYFELINESNQTGFRFWWVSSQDSPECMLYYPLKEEVYNAETGELISNFKSTYFLEPIETGQLKFRKLPINDKVFDINNYDMVRLTKHTFSNQSIQILIKLLNTYQ